MKKWMTRFGIFILLAALLISLAPAMHMRLESEGKNKTVVISVLYNDLQSKFTAQKCDALLARYMEEGIRTVSVMEEDINAMVNRGDVTSIKYNVLRHKYDDESMAIGALIAKACPLVGYDSHVLIAAREEAKTRLARVLPQKYTEEEYAFAGQYEDLDIYVLYDGRRPLWEYTVGYNEEILSALSEKGFTLSLVYKIQNYGKHAYLDEVDRLVKAYRIPYLNLKTNNAEPPQEEIFTENYEKISDILTENGMTLVVTENANQLSNQKPLGYEEIFADVLSEKGAGKVLRAYETYDDSQADASFYQYRTAQYFNSTMDRNIRFITVTLVAPEGVPYKACADYTLRATVEYKEKIEAQGFTVGNAPCALSYTVARKPIYAACGAIMVLCALLVLEMVSGKMWPKLRLFAVLLSLLAALASFVLPATLLALYPTVFCMVMSCTAMTAMLYFVKKKKETLPFSVLLPGAAGVLLGTLLLGAVCMGSMLSGMDYYINNAIFRGIKLSLLVPVAYTAFSYYFMFVKTEEENLAKTLKAVFYADIKVYWVLIGAAVGAVGFYYILRSGNVSSISDMEKLLRNTVTEIFPARPRTKEFLLGYPCLVLFVYYVKKVDWKLVKWLLAVGTSILAASVTNSFCHVFTDFSVIFSRTVNGLLVGAVVSVFVFVLNLLFVKACKAIKKCFEKWLEMK